MAKDRGEFNSIIGEGKPASGIFRILLREMGGNIKRAFEKLRRLAIVRDSRSRA
jgi:hypothetical protein